MHKLINIPVVSWVLLDHTMDGGPNLVMPFIMQTVSRDGVSMAGINKEFLVVINITLE